MIMTATFQLVIDCAGPEPLARFRVASLGYEFEPPPRGKSPGSGSSLGLSPGCSAAVDLNEKSAFDLGGLGLSRVLSVPESKALFR